MIMNFLLDQAFLKKVSNVCLTYIFFLYIFILHIIFLWNGKNVGIFPKLTIRSISRLCPSNWVNPHRRPRGNTQLEE